MKIVNAESIPRNTLPELLLSLWQKRLGKAFRLTKFETSVIENVAAVPVFVAKPRAKCLTVQKLDKQLLFKLVRAVHMEMISVLLY